MKLGMYQVNSFCAFEKKVSTLCIYVPKMTLSVNISVKQPEMFIVLLESRLHGLVSVAFFL